MKLLVRCELDPDPNMKVPTAMLTKWYSMEEAANPTMQQQVCQIMAKLKEGNPTPSNEPAVTALRALLALTAPPNATIHQALVTISSALPPVAATSNIEQHQCQYIYLAPGGDFCFQKELKNETN